jgi:hypothetical protein
MSILPDGRASWRKSSRSTATDTCVELAYSGMVRDSKNPGGPTLRINLKSFLTAAKVGRFDL